MLIKVTANYEGDYSPQHNKDVMLLGKPILFNTEMVQAILEDRKNCTRRIIKRTPSNDEPCGYGFWKDYNEDDKRWYIKDYTHACVWWTLEEYISKFSKYHVGDILYVRETWMMQSMSNFDKKAKFLFKAKPNERLKEVILSSDRYEDLIKYSSKNGWKPSLFMPKEAARIFLKITDVRIEKLHDMTRTDATKEGFKDDDKLNNKGELLTSLGNFSRLWNTTIKKEQFKMYSWDANPWVWVIEFERVKK